MKVDKRISAKRGDWSFGDNIAESFQQHIERSIPLYHEGHEVICQLSDFFALPDSLVYELGCSTGKLLRCLAEHNGHKKNIRWIGLDKEEEMVQFAQQANADKTDMEFYCADISNYEYETADMIVAYYTLQFVEERQRQYLINTIYEKLNWGGAFIMFEKVGAPDARFQDMMSCLYREFKQGRGFTPDEVANKEASLKGILKPFSSQGNADLLRRAGFTDVMTVMKYVAFEGFLAIK
ncbi:MAG: methyltransferase domain-containing protein [Gammaproteobacteria bacterium]